MAKKKALAPRLPHSFEDLCEKGFLENVSKSKRFVTDGHSLLLRKMVTDKKLVKKVDRKDGHVEEAAIASLWNAVAERQHAMAHFIGCGRVKEGGDSRVVACLKGGGNRFVFVDSYKLAFVVRATNADTLVISEERDWASAPVAICRRDTICGMLMPMRYSVGDLKAYDLKTAAPVPLDKVFVPLTLP